METYQLSGAQARAPNRLVRYAFQALDRVPSRSVLAARSLVRVE
jgi:hypothetical protein